MKLSNKQQQITVTALISAILVLAALASVRFFIRLDLSQDKAYSISQVSRNLFKEIDEQVSVTYYVSGRLYKERPEPKRVEDMLREYAATSRGKIRVEVVDPDVSGDAGVVERFGILPQEYRITEKNQASVAMVYTGIIVQYMEKQEVLPVVFRTETLEYDLTRSIRKAVKGLSQVAEVIVGDGDKTWAENYTVLSGSLKAAGWDVREAVKGKYIGDDVTLLLVLGNSGLDEFDLYPVNQYLRRGGAAILALKGVDVMTTYGLYAFPVEKQAAFDMLAAWGLDMPKELVLDPSCLTLPFQMQSPFGGSMIAYVQYPHWVNVVANDVAADNPVTSSFGGLGLFWPSPLKVSAKPGLEAKSLVKSTEKAWRSTANFPINPQEEMRFYEESASTTGQYDLAVTLIGTFPDAFQGKPLPKREGVEADWLGDKAPPAPAVLPGRAVVVSSADFATDIMQYAQGQLSSSEETSPNAQFILSCADWLSSDDDIVSIRTRSYRDTRLNKIEDPKAKKSVIFIVQLFTLAIVPAGVVAYGVVRLVGRRRREKTLRVKEA